MGCVIILGLLLVCLILFSPDAPYEEDWEEDTRRKIEKIRRK